MCVCVIVLLWAALGFPCDSFPHPTASPALLGINVLPLLSITAFTAVGLETTLDVSPSPRPAPLPSWYMQCAATGESPEDLSLNACIKNTVPECVSGQMLASVSLINNQGSVWICGL